MTAPLPDRLLADDQRATFADKLAALTREQREGGQVLAKALYDPESGRATEVDQFNWPNHAGFLNVLLVRANEQPHPEAPGAVAVAKDSRIRESEDVIASFGKWLIVRDRLRYVIVRDGGGNDVIKSATGNDEAEFVEEMVKRLAATPPAPVDVRVPDAEEMRLRMGELTTEEVQIAQAAFRMGALALLSGQPAEVDDAMVERAMAASAGGYTVRECWFAGPKWSRELMRAALQAALGGGGRGDGRVLRRHRRMRLRSCCACR